MKKKSKTLTAFFLLCFSISGIQAQVAITTAGGAASGTGGSVSYTIGQAMYATDAGTTGTVAKGVQQPFEISTVTGLEQAAGVTLQCLAYPNPATDFLTLRMEGEQQNQFIASIYNSYGVLLKTQKVEGNETKIDMRQFVSATYYLKVEQTTQEFSAKEIKTFKIIKN